MGRNDAPKIPPLKGEGDHAQHGGGVSAFEESRLAYHLALTLIPLHRFAVALPFQGRN